MPELEHAGETVGSPPRARRRSPEINEFIQGRRGGRRYGAAMQMRCIALIAALAACATPSSTTPVTRSPTMTTETTTHMIRRLYEDCINPGRLELLDELVSADYVGPRGERGAAGFATTISGLRAAFPDIHFTLDDLFASDASADRVTVRWRWQATHAGTFQSPAGSFPATGKRLTNTGIAIYQLAGGKIVRAWLESDRLGALQQLGALPAAFGAAAAPSAPAAGTARP
jgi:predicted ester cyclase